MQMHHGPRRRLLKSVRVLPCSLVGFLHPTQRVRVSFPCSSIIFFFFLSTYCRVHQFTKVEMFGLTTGQVSASDSLLQELVGIQRELFDRLGYFYKVLDMPLNELGAPAYRKFDIEAWMPGRNMYGEISSASNCTDYQSRRLAIRSIDPKTGERRFVHTVNGTACAVPRSLITLLEMGQKEDGQVDIAKELQPYCNGLKRLTKPEKPFKLKWIKTKFQQPAKSYTI